MPSGHPENYTSLTDVTSFYTIDTSGPKPLITNKKVVLKNDHIHHVIDVYHI